MFQTLADTQQQVFTFSFLKNSAMLSSPSSGTIKKEEEEVPKINNYGNVEFYTFRKCYSGSSRRRKNYNLWHIVFSFSMTPWSSGWRSAVTLKPGNPRQLLTVAEEEAGMLHCSWFYPHLLEDFLDN